MKRSRSSKSRSKKTRQFPSKAFVAKRNKDVENLKDDITYMFNNLEDAPTGFSFFRFDYTKNYSAVHWIFVKSDDDSRKSIIQHIDELFAEVVNRHLNLVYWVKTFNSLLKIFSILDKWFGYAVGYRLLTHLIGNYKPSSYWIRRWNDLTKHKFCDILFDDFFSGGSFSLDFEIYEFYSEIISIHNFKDKTTLENLKTLKLLQTSKSMLYEIFYCTSNHCCYIPTELVYIIIKFIVTE